MHTDVFNDDTSIVDLRPTVNGIEHNKSRCLSSETAAAADDCQRGSIAALPRHARHYKRLIIPLVLLNVGLDSLQQYTWHHKSALSLIVDKELHCCCERFYFQHCISKNVRSSHNVK